MCNSTQYIKSKKLMTIPKGVQSRYSCTISPFRVWFKTICVVLNKIRDDWFVLNKRTSGAREFAQCLHKRLWDIPDGGWRWSFSSMSSPNPCSAYDRYICIIFVMGTWYSKKINDLAQKLCFPSGIFSSTCMVYVSVFLSLCESLYR